MFETLRLAANDTWVVTLRNLIKYKRVPQLIVFSTIQPVMILLLFNFVFGGALRLPSGIDEYINYLLPGTLIQIVVFGITQATVAMAEDLKAGIISRFKSLPMSRFAVVAGRALADMFRNLGVVIVLTIVGFIIGFEFGDRWVNGLFGLLLVLLFSFSMSWVSICIGLLAKDPESAQAASFVWVFPLVFASSIFVPVKTMPEWLQGFAEHQPVSVVTSAVRGFTLNGDHSKLIPALLWCFGIMIVFAFIANRLYKKA